LRKEDTMKNWRGKLKLDKKLLDTSAKYYIYRSEEQAGTRPVIDGVYIQRSALAPNPPEEMTVSFEWA
jgi:hypothetical protein